MDQRIRGAIELIPAEMRAGLAADLSAGDGRATELLKRRGWRVISTERRPGGRGWIAADLEDDLPFRSATFDLVLLLEVIEHLADIPHAFREIARMLKPGGVAIVTTPNRLNITSRIHYLLSGFYKGRRAPLSYRYRVADGRNWHVMGLNDLHWIAHGEGLRMEALGRSRAKLRAKIYAPIFYLPIALFSYMLYVRGVRDPEQRRINRELYSFMTSASVLLDENILMRFRRMDDVRNISGGNGAAA
jgi:SAM-dependent methyltransferase